MLKSTVFVKLLKVKFDYICLEDTKRHRLRVFRKPGYPGDGRFIITEDEKPFFYLGDAAWELFHRLNCEEAEHYLRDRSTKGFAVIQSVVLAEF